MLLNALLKLRLKICVCFIIFNVQFAGYNNMDTSDKTFVFPAFDVGGRSEKYDSETCSK